MEDSPEARKAAWTPHWPVLNVESEEESYALNQCRLIVSDVARRREIELTDAELNEIAELFLDDMDIVLDELPMPLPAPRKH